MKSFQSNKDHREAEPAAHRTIEFAVPTDEQENEVTG